MTHPRFRSDSIIDRLTPASDTTAANALVPVVGNDLDRAWEYGRSEDQVIDGEFKVQEASGFSCRECCESLLVGSRECPQCRKQFSLPTPNIVNVPTGYSPVRARVMLAIYKDRITTEELVRRQAITEPTVSNPSYRPSVRPTVKYIPPAKSPFKK